jgi:hypothetical protein
LSVYLGAPAALAQSGSAAFPADPATEARQSFAKASVSDNGSNSATDEQSTVVPLLNLNLGWSF